MAYSSMKKLPIFFSFNNGYVATAAVTFESLLTNTPPGIFYELYVLHTDLSIENRGLLQELVDRHENGHLKFIDMKEAFQRLDVCFDNKNYCLGDRQTSFTRETLFRCLPTLVKEFDSYDVILYSDVDICVVDDISDIFELNLGSNYIAGCRIPKMFEEGIKHIPLRVRKHYVAGGIWLMNLKQMRMDKLEDRIIGLMINPPFRLLWNDQDIMNLACETKIAYLSYRYCSIPRWEVQLNLAKYHDEYYPHGELREAMCRPKIVHYAANKPWDGPCDKGELWHFWHARTGLPPLPSTHRDEANVRAYLFKYFKIPGFFVSAHFRNGEFEIKILEFVLRIKLRKITEQ